MRQGPTELEAKQYKSLLVDIVSLSNQVGFDILNGINWISHAGSFKRIILSFLTQNCYSNLNTRLSAILIYFFFKTQSNPKHFKQEVPLCLLIVFCLFKSSHVIYYFNLRILIKIKDYYVLLRNNDAKTRRNFVAIRCKTFLFAKISVLLRLTSHFNHT